MVFTGLISVYETNYYQSSLLHFYVLTRNAEIFFCLLGSVSITFSTRCGNAVMSAKLIINHTAVGGHFLNDLSCRLTSCPVVSSMIVEISVWMYAVCVANQGHFSLITHCPLSTN